MLSSIQRATGREPLEVLHTFRMVRGLPQGWRLTGLCLKTSAALVEWLAALGVEAELVAGVCAYDDEPPSEYDYGNCSHAWAVCEGFIIDLTAGQYGDYPDVLILPADCPDYQARHTGRKAWTAGAFGWSPDQRLVITQFVAQILRSGQLQNNWRERLEALGL
jgi:hypothetical protein